MATTRLTRHIRAPRGRVYRALLDAGAIQRWMVPDIMTSHVHAFDAREGGEFRISLSYASPDRTGKTAAQTHTFHGDHLHTARHHRTGSGAVRISLIERTRRRRLPGHSRTRLRPSCLAL